ncbi:protein cholesin [Rhinoraja longicauda]
MAKEKKSKLSKVKLSTDDPQPAPEKPDPTRQKRKKRARSQDTEEKPMDGIEGEEELSPEAKRTMERKLKKERKKEEKKTLREASVVVQEGTPQRASACQLALEYLTTWSTNRKEWRFQKTRQIWLLQHMYDRDQVSDKHFTLLLDYLQGLQGNARELTVQKTEALMKQSGSTDDPTDISAEKMERMKQVVQLLF